MKNKKRTLIILLVLIVIILIVLGIVIFVGGIRDKEVKNFYKQIEEITCEYAKEEKITESLCYGFSNLCQVKFNTLISWGYLDENLENPLTHEKVSENTTSYVEISWKDNEMICTFKEG